MIVDFDLGWMTWNPLILAGMLIGFILALWLMAMILAAIFKRR